MGSIAYFLFLSNEVLRRFIMWVMNKEHMRKLNNFVTH